MRCGRHSSPGLGQAGIHVEHLNFLLGHVWTQLSRKLLNPPTTNGTTANPTTPSQLWESGAQQLSRRRLSEQSCGPGQPLLLPVSMPRQEVVTTQVGELISIPCSTKDSSEVSHFSFTKQGSFFPRLLHAVPQTVRPAFMDAVLGGGPPPSFEIYLDDVPAGRRVVQSL